MLFSDVQSALIAILRMRIRNGELTERGLARLVGVSQPHIHNVLKGARLLSAELSDQILVHLRISLLDLIEREQIEAHLNFAGANGGYIYVPVLDGAIGPRFPWPTRLTKTDRLPFPSSQAGMIPNPVAARLAEDSRMANFFAAGDIALLDSSQRARRDIDLAAFYVVKCGNAGIIRRIELSSDSMYLIAGDSPNRPSCWERVRLEGSDLTQYIRARAYVSTPLHEWTAS